MSHAELVEEVCEGDVREWHAFCESTGLSVFDPRFFPSRHLRCFLLKEAPPEPETLLDVECLGKDELVARTHLAVQRGGATLEGHGPSAARYSEEELRAYLGFNIGVFAQVDEVLEGCDAMDDAPQDDLEDDPEQDLQPPDGAEGMADGAGDGDDGAQAEVQPPEAPPGRKPLAKPVPKSAGKAPAAKAAANAPARDAPARDAPASTAPKTAWNDHGGRDADTEDFIARYELDESASQALRDMPAELRSRIIVTGDMRNIRNPSSFVISRCVEMRRAAGLGPLRKRAASPPAEPHAAAKRPHGSSGGGPAEADYSAGVSRGNSSSSSAGAVPLGSAPLGARPLRPLLPMGRLSAPRSSKAAAASSLDEGRSRASASWRSAAPASGGRLSPLLPRKPRVEALRPLGRHDAPDDLEAPYDPEAPPFGGNEGRFGGGGNTATRRSQDTSLGVRRDSETFLDRLLAD